MIRSLSNPLPSIFPGGGALPHGQRFHLLVQPPRDKRRVGFDADFQIRPSAYVHAPDGTLAAMHDTVRRATVKSAASSLPRDRPRRLTRQTKPNGSDIERTER